MQKPPHHFPPIRMVIIKTSRDSKCWWRCGEKETLFIIQLLGMKVIIKDHVVDRHGGKNS
jgi:hypothetical protein